MANFYKPDFKEMRLAAPWVEYYHMISTFFDDDKDIRVLLDNENRNVRIYVKTQDKYTALNKMLKEEIKEEDTVLCTVTVLPPNEAQVLDLDADDLIYVAFSGNPIISRVLQSEHPFGFTYVLFTPVIVRYRNDSLAEWDGYATTTYQDIAKKIFKPIDGLFWTTDTAD